jgi:hypothetical protein
MRAGSEAEQRGRDEQPHRNRLDASQIVAAT